METRGLISACLALLLLGTSGSKLAANPAAGTNRAPKKQVHFTTDIEPILKAHCYSCHGSAVQSGITDQPTAALLEDLKRRGLLESTLVIWGGEFGRTPMVENRQPGRPDSLGRDHHRLAFSLWMAGGGIKAGHVVGRSDDLGFKVVEDPIHIHDLHATILHCLGLDHKQLTYRHQGRDFRLIDVAGQVAQKVLA